MFGSSPPNLIKPIMGWSQTCCIYRYIHGYVVIMIFKFGEYCFIKLKKSKFKFWIFLSIIRNSVCSISQRFCSIDRSDEKNNPGVFAWFNGCLIPIQSIEKSLRSMLDSSRLIKTCKTKFSAEFSSNYSKWLKIFQALWTVLRNISTLHTCLLMKYNPMGINSSLCSLDKIFSLPKKLVRKETQNILWSFSKIVIYRTQQFSCILGTSLL